MAQSTAVLGALAQNQTNALTDHTRAATYTATAPLIQRLAAAQTASTHAWIRTTSNPRTPLTADQAKTLAADARQRITTAMTGQAAHAQRIATHAARTAGQLGTQQAAAFAQHAGATTPAVDTPPLGPDATQAIGQLPHAVQQDHDAALAMLTAAALTALGLAAITAAINRARRAISRIRVTINWAVTAQVAKGVTAIASAIGTTPGTTGAVLMWVAEPRACPACVAYAGLTIEPGHRFPGGLSTDPAKALYPSPVDGPPRHVNCRCTLIPWHPAWQDPTQPPMADVVRAQATRP